MNQLKKRERTRTIVTGSSELELPNNAFNALLWECDGETVLDEIVDVTERKN